MKRRAKVRRRAGQGVSVRRVRPDILQEVSGIVESARQGQTRVVGFGPLVLFASETGDAWLLDWQKESAVCLMRDGEAQQVKIRETETAYSIEWTSTYSIHGDAMTFQHSSGRIVSIQGYPTGPIVETVGYLRRGVARLP